MRDWLKLRSKQIKRWPMHLSIHRLTDWHRLTDPEPGYTVIIACMKDLAAVAVANLRLIGRMNLGDMKELLLVFDCTTDEMPANVLHAVDQLDDRFSVRVLGYSPRQARVARRINWGWVFSWLSWCTGIAVAKTRHVILHDLDAMPLEADIFDTLYANAVESGAPFHGILPRNDYPNAGGEPLVATCELVIDAAYVREMFRPFDTFNKLRMINGRYFDFDTFLYAQSRSTRRCLTPIDESQLVHPSQLICSYTDFVAGRRTLASTNHNMLILPYFQYMGNEEEPMRAITPRLSDLEAREVPFARGSLPIAGVEPNMWAWMEKQIHRVEQALFDRTRDEVERYLSGMVRRSGGYRTVGRETQGGVPEQ